MQTPESPVLKTQRWVVFTSVFLFAIKMLAYFLTGSVAILTDALESTVNMVTAFTGWYSLQLSAKPRDADHPYGHGKVELISASFEGILILVAGGIIMYEAAQSLLRPHDLQQLDFGLALISFTAAVNYAVGRWCVQVGKKYHSIALAASGKHLQTDTWSTLGIIGGLALIRFTGLMWLDSAVAIIMAGVIIWEGIGIIRETMAGIMDEADTALLRRLVAMLDGAKQPNWIDLHNLRVIKYGSVLHIDCHLTVPWYFNVNEAHAEVEVLQQHIRHEFPQPLEMFVHVDGCTPPESCRVCPRTTCAVRALPFEQRVPWTLENVTLDAKHGISSLRSE